MGWEDGSGARRTLRDMSNEAQQDQQHVIDLLSEAKIAMLTYVDPSNKLVAKPMSTQEIGRAHV